MNKELIKAVTSGNLEGVKKILASRNIDVNARYGKDQITLLMLAARWGHLNIVEYLLNDKKANINAVSNQCFSALGEAAIEGHLHIVSYLLEVAKPKASIDIRNRNYNTTALHCAAACQHSRQVLVYLCSKYPDATRKLNGRGENILHVAVKNDFTTNIEFLTRIYPEMLFVGDEMDMNPFHLNLFEGSVKNLKLFCSLRPELLNTKSKLGFTPLLVACFGGNLEIVKYLLTEANPRSSLEETCPQGQTALHWAAASGNLELVKYLISRNKINEEQRDKNGYTPLHYAITHGRVNVIQYFLSRGAGAYIIPPDDFDDERRFLDLMQKTQGHGERLVDLSFPILIAATALIDSAYDKSSDIDDLLLSLGTGINGRVYTSERSERFPLHQNNTALHAALMKDPEPNVLNPNQLINPLLVIKLLEAGASLDIQNKEKISCFELLISQENSFYHALAYFYKAKALILKRTEFYMEESSRAEVSKTKFSSKEALKTILSLEEALAEYPNPQNEKHEVKETLEQERLDQQLEEQIQEYLTKASECSERKMSEEDRNLLLFVMGSSLATPYASAFSPKPNTESESRRDLVALKAKISLLRAKLYGDDFIDPKDAYKPRNTVSPYPIAAYNFLSRVGKTNATHYVKANELLYQLLASGQVHLEIASIETKKQAESEGLGLAEAESLDDDENTAATSVPSKTASSNSAEQIKHQVVLKLSHPETEVERVLRLEYLIKYTIHANLQYAVLGKNIAAYTQGEEQSMVGIKGFVSFREPESCFALVKTMRQDHVTLEQEKHAMAQENQALKAKHNAEMAQMRALLQEIETRLHSQSTVNQQNGVVVPNQSKAVKRNEVRRKSL